MPGEMENEMRSMRSKNGNEHKCCTCYRTLSPHRDAVVYLGWGQRDDGQPGLGWVAALCAPTPPQLSSGSPCVQAARDLAGTNGITLIPTDYAAWLGE